MLEKIKAFWNSILKWSKRVKMPLAKQLSLYQVMLFFSKSLIDGNVSNRAGSISFSFFLALFPGFLFFFTLIPFFPIQGLEEEIFKEISRILPPDTYDSVYNTIKDIISNKRGGLLSFGFISAMFFATSGIRSLIDNFDQTIHSEKERSFIQKVLVSTALTIVVAILFIIGIILIIFSANVLNDLLGYFHLAKVSPTIVETTRILLLIFLVFFGISTLYNWGSVYARKWPFFSPGAVLATILIVLGSIGFSYYVSNFAQYNKLYGSIGTVMIIMVWIYLNAAVLIVGFELNASISKASSQPEKT